MDLALIVALFGEEEVLEEWERYTGPSPASHFQVVYVYGFSPHIEPLISWVEEDKDRVIVFIEDDLRAVRKLQTEIAMPEHEQIHLNLLLPDNDLESFCEEIAARFPFSNIGFVNLKKNQDQFETLRLMLLRKSVVEDALQIEMLQYHRLFLNLQTNAYRLPESFDLSLWKDAFKGVPLILCGAGPSLGGMSEVLKQMDDRALILAGGSTIPLLGSMNITPHLAFAIDPNSEEFTRLCFHTAYETPLIYGTRVEPNIFRTHVGPTGYLSTGTGGALEKWLEERLGIFDAKILEGLGEEAMSVTAIALMTAIYLGANPIVLMGIDLAFADGKRYAPGVISDFQCSLEEQHTRASEMLMQKSGKVTATKWIMEALVIENVAKQHPEITWIDGTGRGLGFSNIPYDPLFEKRFTEIYDLRGKIHEIACRTKFSFSSLEVKNSFRLFRESLIRVDCLIDEILKDPTSPRVIVLEMDLEEELAYQLALKPFAYASSFHLRKQDNSSAILFRKMKSVVADYLQNLLYHDIL